MSLIDDVTERVLNISTAHIPKRTGEALGYCTGQSASEYEFFLACTMAPLWNVISYTPWSVYGWIIWAGHETDEIEKEHPELARLMRFATGQRYTYLKLDCDATTLPDFDTFDWS